MKEACSLRLDNSIRRDKLLSYALSIDRLSRDMSARHNGVGFLLGIIYSRQECDEHRSKSLARSLAYRPWYISRRDSTSQS